MIDGWALSIAEAPANALHLRCHCNTCPQRGL